MSDIAKCTCGQTPDVMKVQCDLGMGYIVRCECGWKCPPHEEKKFTIAAWNLVMRPRPVVTEQKHERGDFMLGDLCVGCCIQTDRGDFQANYSDETDFVFRNTLEEARAWLTAKLTAAGFDVAESEAK